MSDASGVSSFFEMVRAERANAERFNQPEVETKIEEKPAVAEQTTEQPAGEPAAEAPATATE